MKRYPGNPAVTRLNDLTTLAPDEYAKRVSGVAVKLDALSRSTVEQITRNPDFAMDDILGRRGLVSVVAPLQDGQLAQTLSGLFVNDLLFRAYNRFASAAGVRLLLVLDEAAQLADRIDYKNLLSVARSARIAVLLAVQDITQFADPNERSTVFGNCSTYISFSGVSHDSAKMLSDRLGQHSVLTTTVGRTPGTIGYQTTVSNTTSMAPVLGLREIMMIPFGTRQAVVHSRDILPSPFFVDFA